MDADSYRGRAGRLSGAACVLVLSFLSGSPALGWGEEGHEAIARIAQAGLSAKARLRIRQLLGVPADQLSARMQALALWPDNIRTWQRAWEKARQTDPQAPLPPPPAELKDVQLAKAFILRKKGGARVNDNQPNWHFVNLPQKLTTYQLGGTGTRADDIVQIIKRCVARLQNDPQPGEAITRKEALRLLIHFVGDVHQPLHSGVGYWLKGPANAARLAEPDEVDTPDEVSQAANYIGGNSIDTKAAQGGPNPGADTLHRLWDGVMVRRARQATGATDYVAHLIELVKADHGEVWTQTGDPQRFAEEWAGESAGVAGEVYAPLDKSGITVTGNVGKRKVHGAVEIPLSYLNGFTETTNKRLMRGGLRLAQLLNGIWP